MHDGRLSQSVLPSQELVKYIIVLQVIASIGITGSCLWDTSYTLKNKVRRARVKFFHISLFAAIFSCFLSFDWAIKETISWLNQVRQSVMDSLLRLGFLNWLKPIYPGIPFKMPQMTDGSDGSVSKSPAAHLSLSGDFRGGKKPLKVAKGKFAKERGKFCHIWTSC